MKKNHILVLSVALAAALGLVALAGCGQGDPPQSASGQAGAAQEKEQASGSSSQDATDQSPAADASEGKDVGPTDGDAPVPDGNSVGTDFYTVYFDRDLTASVDEAYEPGDLAMGCLTTVEKDGKPLYYVGVFSSTWGPEGDYYSAKAGSCKDSQGNPVSVWVYGFCDVVTQEQIDQAASRVEMR